MSNKAIGAAALGGEADSIAVASPLAHLEPATTEPTATTEMPETTNKAGMPETTNTTTEAIPLSASLPAPVDAASMAPDRTTGFYSPPDSNTDGNHASKTDGGSSDSELSELDDDVLAEALSVHPDDAEPVATIKGAMEAFSETTNNGASKQSTALPVVPGAPADPLAAAAASSDHPAGHIAAEDDDIGDIEPDPDSGSVPVFRPTMQQFRDFKKFMEKIDEYGMRSGIVKIIPPQEWKDSLMPIDEMVKTIKVREPIKQDIMGSNGTYRQVNIVHQRTYNLPQWRQLCDQSEHQPPARRGERRANADKPKTSRSRPAAAAGTAASATASTPGAGGASVSTGTTRKTRRGRTTTTRRRTRQTADEDTASVMSEPRPMTPESQRGDDDRLLDDDKTCVGTPEDSGIMAPEDRDDKLQDIVMASVEGDRDRPIKKEVLDEGHDESSCVDAPPAPRRRGFTRQASANIQSTSARRKYAKREGSVKIDETAFKDWDYRMDVSDYTPERCEELERIYWKTLTYAQPLYGADLPGTLFDESTELWNLNRLPSLLDVLGTNVPGVNTAYLYLGMWKATFAWHLEDVDLYSINYLHFGAPKQWYSIPQSDASRFEEVMKRIWPADAKACDQFLRHKAFLISPSYLLQQHNIKVNKCVSYPGEFVVTYPYGYHSGYNLGYNCAEAVNFALDSWLPMGKVAKKCECAQAQDSVWVDVYEIERKLRGLSSEDDEEEDDDSGEDMDDVEDLDEQDGSVLGLPTPPSGSRPVRAKAPGSKKRKRRDEAPDKGEKEDAGERKLKRMRLRLQSAEGSPCCLCPNDIPFAEILSTDDGRKAHRLCAEYLPEPCIDHVDGQDVVTNVGNFTTARLEVRCRYCRLRKGVCFQCTYAKCSRAYHATCAAPAGVFVEHGEVPVFGEDGTEYKEQAFEFTCRFQRAKRDRRQGGEVLEKNERIRKAAAALREGTVCQMQLYRSDIFAGVVLENRADEEMLLLHVIPSGDKVEVAWKWLLLPDASEYRLPRASPNAMLMPKSVKAREDLGAKRLIPLPDDVFVEGYKWKEFLSHQSYQSSGSLECAATVNKDQAKVDLSKPDQLWHYLGRLSTDSKPHYTDDPSRPVHNPKSVFLDSLPRPQPIFTMPPPPSRPSLPTMPALPTMPTMPVSQPTQQSQLSQFSQLSQLSKLPLPTLPALPTPPTVPTLPAPSMPSLLSQTSQQPFSQPLPPATMQTAMMQNAMAAQEKTRADGSRPTPVSFVPPANSSFAGNVLNQASTAVPSPTPSISSSAAMPAPEPRRSYSVIKPPYVPHTSPVTPSAAPPMQPPTQLPGQPPGQPPGQAMPVAASSIPPAQSLLPPPPPPPPPPTPSGSTVRRASDSFPTPRRSSAKRQHGSHRPNASFSVASPFGSHFAMPAGGNGGKFPQIQHPNLSHGYASIPVSKPPPGTLSAASMSPPSASGESKISLPPPPPRKATPLPTTISKKYAFFQVHCNRDPSAYRSPYGPPNGAGSSSNKGQQDSSGTVRTHWKGKRSSSGGEALAAAAKKLHRRGASSTSSSSSFGFGFGLTGLMRPSAHTNYVGPAPAPPSTVSSPFMSVHNLAFGTGPGSTVSSYSYDSVMTGGGGHMSPHSPAPLDASPFVGSPGPPMSAFDFPTGPAAGGPFHHPGMRPQFHHSWQQGFNTPLFSQDINDVNFSPPSPLTPAATLPTGLGAAANILPGHQHSFSFSGTTLADHSPLLSGSVGGFGSMSPPLLEESPLMSPTLDEPEPPDGGTSQSPADQLKQQLRSISDSSLPSSYRLKCLHQPRRRHQSRSSLNRIFTSQLLDLNPT